MVGVRSAQLHLSFVLSVSFSSKSSQHTLREYFSSIQLAQNLIASLIPRVGCPKTSVQAASGSMSNAILSPTLFLRLFGLPPASRELAPCRRSPFPKMLAVSLPANVALITMVCPHCGSMTPIRLKADCLSSKSQLQTSACVQIRWGCHRSEARVLQQMPGECHGSCSL